MSKDSSGWRSDLTSCFEDLKVVERCREEAVEHFGRFCDYVAEPAFQALAGEFLRYRVKARSWSVKGKSVHFEVRFPRSQTGQFHYILWMPKNSIELKLKLTIKSRKSPLGPLEEKTVPFIENVPPKEILALDKDSLAQDVIARYRKFLYEAAASPSE
jgi:hypothetical protein